MNRRQMLGGLAAAAGLCACSPSGAAFGADGNGKGTMKTYPSEYFYTDGQFDQEKAKKAFYELFEYHGYALAETMKKSPDFWVAEFGLGDYARVGMAGIFFVNDKEHGYFGHEIFLLPGQMIPEHYHLAAEGKPAKHEAWQVRHGSIHTMAYGGSPADCPVELPKSQLEAGAITCFKAKKCEVGDMDVLAELGQPHFMIAGPEGAIVTEYASYHSMDGLGFTNKNAAL